MSRSEIFDSFVKIAQEKRMISNDSNEAKKKLEKTHRADSLSISDIEALYGVKPDVPKNMEYEHNIMESAHPNSIVVSPSYDKLNGLVENNNERQNIILHILDKTPNGHLTNHKYAEKEFISTLVSLANDLDNHNKEELRILADACLMQVSAKNKQLKKTAVPILPIVAALAGVLSFVWAKDHMENWSRGLKEDYDRLTEYLNKFLTSVTNMGVGHTYDDKLKSDVSGYLDRLQQFMDAYEESEEVIRSIEIPTDGDGKATDRKAVVTEVKSGSPKTNKSREAARRLTKVLDSIKQYTGTIKRDFSSDFYKKRHTSQTGGITSLLEMTHLLGGNNALVSDYFVDVLTAIPAFESSAHEVIVFLEQGIPEQAKKEADNIASHIRERKPAAAKSEPSHSDEEVKKQHEKINKDMEEAGLLI